MERPRCFRNRKRRGLPLHCANPATSLPEPGGADTMPPLTTYFPQRGAPTGANRERLRPQVSPSGMEAS